jgi:hypothetical protein
VVSCDYIPPLPVREDTSEEWMEEDDGSVYDVDD